MNLARQAPASPSTGVDDSATLPTLTITQEQLAEYRQLKAAERKRVRQRQLRANSPTATGGRVVSMLRATLPRLADHVALGAVAPGDLRELRNMLDGAVNVAIGRLLDQGYTWSQIGAELGISAQGAHQRWQRHQKRNGQ